MGSLRVPAHFGVRSDRYKLIFFYGLTQAGTNPTPAAWEFYDLQNDPFEMKNEYANAKFKTQIAEMKVQLRQTREELAEGDKNPAILNVIKKHWN